MKELWTASYVLVVIMIFVTSKKILTISTFTKRFHGV